MMNPDVFDPVWQRERERKWDSISKEWKKDFTKKEMKVLKEWFLGGAYEYGNIQKYGEGLAWSWGWPWILSPVQTCDSWRKLIQEDLKRWEGDRYSMKEGLNKIACLHAENNTQYGWDFATHLEVATFVLGGKFVKGNYFFCGVPCKYPFSVSEFHNDWILGACRWLSGVASDDETVITHFIDHWFEVMQQSHSAYFEKKVSRTIPNEQERIHGLMQHARNYQVIVEAADRECCLTETGAVNRLEFGKKLKDYFESVDRPVCAQELYETVTDKNYERPFSRDYISKDKDISWQQLRDGG